eukprot:Lankesteria_metandrocarpae@DN3014_c0_g1_i1.p1
MALDYVHHTRRLIASMPHYINQKLLVNDLDILSAHVPTLGLGVTSAGHSQMYQTGRRLYLQGTVPIEFKKRTYNIPVSLYLEPDYPSSPPRCVVTPTPGMSIVNSHAHVDKGGSIHLKSLTHWSLGGRSLLEAVQEMIQIFSKKPPVVATVEGSTPELSSRSGRKGILTDTKKSSRFIDTHWADATNPLFQNLCEQLRMQEDLVKMIRDVEMENKTLIQDTADVRSQRETVKAVKKQAQKMLVASESLPYDAEAAIGPADGLSEQVLATCTAAVTATEILIIVEELFKKGVITLDQMLEEVRRQSREQYVAEHMCSLATERQKKLLSERNGVSPD